jgi:methyltransferase (TIGR00027 family)
MRKGWSSQTAILVSAWRGLGAFDSPSVSHDPIAKVLVPQPWRIVLEAAEKRPRLARTAMGVANVLSGGLARHLPMRTRAIDDAVTEAVASGARQIVLLGAELDARAHRLEALEDCIVFEVDHPSTQAEKRAAVVDLPVVAREVRYVTVDFSKDDLARALRDAGHMPSKPSAIVWEGVTMYLDVPAIEATLATVAGLSAKGSMLMTTYQDMSRPPGWRLVRPVFALVGEPLRTNFEPRDLEALLAKHGFDVVSDEGDAEWSERMFARTLRRSFSERLATAKRR